MLHLKNDLNHYSEDVEDNITVKPSFHTHVSDKSQTIGDFTVSRPSQILPRYWEFEVSIGDRRHFYLSKQFRGLVTS